MLLCNEGRHCEEQRLFDCYKAVHTSGSNSQAFLEALFSPRTFQSNSMSKGFPHGGRHLFSHCMHRRGEVPSSRLGFSLR